jgi:hypothetical protein
MKKNNILRLLMVMVCMATSLASYSQSDIFRNLQTLERLKYQHSQDAALLETQSAIERFTTDFIRYGRADSVVIPVVFHDLVGNGATPVTLAEVQAQIDVLNQCFSKREAELQIPWSGSPVRQFPPNPFLSPLRIPEAGNLPIL